jgi:predicted nucleic acid-binding protein
VGLLLDASPLIYLAKIDALDALKAYEQPAIAPEVHREVVAPGLGYRYPDSLAIDRAIESGLIAVVPATAQELARAEVLVADAGGLHVGEAVTLSIAAERGWSACLFERQAKRLAGALGVHVVDPVEVLFVGTEDGARLRQRVRRFGALVNMRLEQLEALLDLIEERSR